MSIAHHIREIGRGKDGTRSLGRTQAHELMSQVLDGDVSDLELGAFAIAMRLKGETADELAGFLDAAHARCIDLEPSAPTIVLPSYNGARKLPNLTALLALLLAQEGAQVLVHGVDDAADRVTTAAIFRDLGLPFARDAAAVAAAFARRQPVFLPTEVFCPALMRLLGVRQITGLRNSAHTIVKLLMPWRGAPVLRVVNHTHPDYAVVLRDLLGQTGADALLMRGTEGEPAADPRRAAKLDVFIAGRFRAELSAAATDPMPGALPPLLPPSQDAAATARYIQAVVDGERPVPAPLLRQVDCLLLALAACCDERRQASSASPDTAASAITTGPWDISTRS